MIEGIDINEFARSLSIISLMAIALYILYKRHAKQEDEIKTFTNNTISEQKETIKRYEEQHEKFLLETRDHIKAVGNGLDAIAKKLGNG